MQQSDKLLNFIDTYSGYNQILINKADQVKTAFTTDQGLYCYRVMPFGLKNDRATYQRLVNKMFAPLNKKSMEVYVDDMLVKSKRLTEHVGDLKECFDILRQYQMKLNPAKCAFGVEFGKFLRFILKHYGIKVNPTKAQAVVDLQPLYTIKEVQRLTGMIVTLSRFVSMSTDKCHPFF